MLTIREIRPDELNILEDMLYLAIYLPEGAEALPRDVIYKPEIFVYIDRFSSLPDDHALVAELDGTIVGCVWVRILAGDIKGFGNIDNQTPEFAIAIRQGHRGQGIGTALMREMIAYLKKSGYKQTSLSVCKENYAQKLYKKVGFEIVAEQDDDYLMVLSL